MNSSSRHNVTLLIPLSVSPHQYFYFAYNSLLGQDLQNLWYLKWPPHSVMWSHSKPQDRLQVTACRLKVAICCLKVAGWILFCYIWYASGYRLKVADCRLQAYGFRLNVECCSWMVEGRRLEVASIRLQVWGFRFKIEDCRLKVAGCRLKVVGRRLKA